MRSGFAGGNKRGHRFVLGHIKRQEDPEWWLSSCRREIHNDKGGRKERVRQEGALQIYFENHGCNIGADRPTGKGGNSDCQDATSDPRRPLP